MSLPANAPPVTFVLTHDRSRSKPFYAGILGLKVLGEDDHAVADQEETTLRRAEPA